MNTKKIMHFLKGIAANNNREWFQEHKAEYDAVKDDFEKGVEQIIAQLSTFDVLIVSIVIYVSHPIRVHTNVT